jgi:isopenicillin-N epimerase
MTVQLSMRRLWTLDPAVTFLNHGSFGACPVQVLEAQSAIRASMEREPVRFFVRELEPLLDASRAKVATLLGAAKEDIAFVPNATSGVNTVLRSLDLAPGDELLTTDHAYNACHNALAFVAARAGAHVTVARLPFPLPAHHVEAAEDTIVNAILDRVTSRTRLALLDHVTSPTALVLPVDRLVAELSARGVLTLVDAAHAPAMVPLHLNRTGAAYTAGNFHKWACAPKGAAFLHVRRDLQESVRPLTISHGANAARKDRSRFLLEADWTGTSDPSATLSIPAALRFLGGLLSGGLPALMEHNHAAAIAARDALLAAIGTVPVCPGAMLGSMASVILPGPAATVGEEIDPLQEALFERFHIEVPIFPFAGKRLLRVSTPIYTTTQDITALVDALRALGVARPWG